MLAYVEEDTKFFNGANDRVFKTLVSEEKYGKLILEAILKEVFDEEVTIEKFLSVEQPLERAISRRKVLDCLVKVAGKYINVEVNLSDYKPAKAVRNFAYLCDFYSQNTTKGKDYDIKTLYIQINLNYGSSPYIRRNKIITKSYMQDEDGILIDNFIIWNVFVENIKRVCYNNPNITDKYKYILMLGLNKEELKNFYPSDEIVNIYRGEIMRLNSNADFVRQLTEEEDAEKLNNTEKYLAREEGKTEEKLDNARKMKEKGFSIKDIQDITGLSEQEILKL